MKKQERNIFEVCVETWAPQPAKPMRSPARPSLNAARRNARRCVCVRMCVCACVRVCVKAKRQKCMHLVSIVNSTTAVIKLLSFVCLCARVYVCVCVRERVSVMYSLFMGLSENIFQFWSTAVHLCCAHQFEVCARPRVYKCVHVVEGEMNR